MASKEDSPDWPPPLRQTPKLPSPLDRPPESAMPLSEPSGFSASLGDALAPVPSTISLAPSSRDPPPAIPRSTVWPRTTPPAHCDALTVTRGSSSAQAIPIKHSKHAASAKAANTTAANLGTMRQRLLMGGMDLLTPVALSYIVLQLRLKSCVHQTGSITGSV